MNCINHPETPAVAYCRTCGKALCEACQHNAKGTVYCAEHNPASAPQQAAPVPPLGATPSTPPPGATPSAPPPGATRSNAVPPSATTGAGASTGPVSAGAASSGAASPSNGPSQSLIPPLPGASSWTDPNAASTPFGVPQADPYAGDPHASPGIAFVLGLIPGVGAIYNGQYVKGLIHVIVLGLLISIVNADTTGPVHPLFGMLIGVWWFYMAFEAYHTAKRRQMGHPIDEFSSIVPLHRRGFPTGPVVLIGFGVLFLLNTMNIVTFEQIIRYWPVMLIVLGVYMLVERMSVGSHPGPSRREINHEQR